MADITGHGWEFFIQRQSVQTRGDRTRTVGSYRIFHNGQPQDGPAMAGATAESHGPGKNHPENNGHRIEAGRYPLWTQGGGDYVTIGYVISSNPNKTPKPGLELKNTGARTEILLHPGHDFLASVGCINACTSLPNAQEDIDFEPSRDRIITIINNLKAFVGEATFPKHNGHPIPNAFIVIDGEP